MSELCGETGADALVAEACGAIVGHVMVAVGPGGSAGEVAFVVHDAWRRRGVASCLLEAAAARACDCGLAALIAYIPDGRPDILRLLGRVGPRKPLAREDSGLLRAEVLLDPVA